VRWLTVAGMSRRWGAAPLSVTLTRYVRWCHVYPLQGCR
jgi:hypothetical protein